MKIIQITDTHLFADDTALMFGVPCNVTFNQTIKHIVENDFKNTDYIFLTGDISQDKSEKSYRIIAESLSALNIPVYWIPGNHDDSALAETVFSQYSNFKRQTHLSTTHWHFIFLDSTVENSNSGFLSQTELNLLKYELNRAPNDKKISIVMHHHPIPTQTPLIDKYILEDRADFFNIISGYFVSLIICGHVHGDYKINSDNITLEASPSTCMQWKKGAVDLQTNDHIGYKIYQFEKTGYQANAVLFPSVIIDPNEKLRTVDLVAYDPNWPQLFLSESKKIKLILGDNCVDIYHIGSTAIPNIYAKPVIDMMPVVKDIAQVDTLNAQFEALGYICMGEYGIPGRRFYWKSKEKRTHHIHLFEQGSTEITRHVAFKNFMLKNAAYAKAYSLLKRNLATVFYHDIVNYVDGKASFIQMIDYKTGCAHASQLHAKDNINIEPYNPSWEKLAEAEIKTIQAVTQKLPIVAIEHIGSTAVSELSSKPIIDIIIVLKSMDDANNWIKPLEALGYDFWSDNPDKTHFRFFKGMPPFGKRRTHHIHIVDKNNNTFEQRILFRNILRNDRKIRQQYELLKLTFAKKYSTDREAYTDSKSNFIAKVLEKYGYKKIVLR